MDNRRQHYRHEFAPTRRFVVRLQVVEGTSVLEGELINLSVGGMCVYAPKLRSETADRWTATLSLSADNSEVSLLAERIHVRTADRSCYGFRFLEIADLEAAEEQEKKIWRFLLDEQRRRRRFLNGG